MKKYLFTLLAAMTFTFMSYAQAPGSMKYQAVLRDASSAILTNQTVDMQFTIYNSSMASIWQDTYTLTSNGYGLVNVELGPGLESIAWDSDSYTIETAVDFQDGGGMITMGSSSILSVPYALHSNTADIALTDNVDDADSDATNELQVVSFSNDTLYLSNGGSVYLGDYAIDNVDDADNDPTNELQDWTTLPGIPVDFQDGIDNVDDADNDPTNEIQTVSVSGTTLSLSNGGGSVSIADNDNNSSNELQTLNYSGNTLSISAGNSVTIPNGDITGVTAGNGLTGGGTTGDITLAVQANNGLNVDIASDAVQLGGSLLENTTISQGPYSMTHNLNGTGDFVIQDAGLNHFEVRDNGISYFGGNTQWKETSTAGTTIGMLLADGNDGRFVLYENAGISMNLDANSYFIFNEQGLDRDFRVESDTRTSMLHVDAANDLVRFGSATASIAGDGTTVSGVVVDYVADFDIGAANGTAIGVGSIEYLLDGTARTMINNSFNPTTHMTRDLGLNTTSEAWDDVFADNFVNVSDIREKKNVLDNKYGLQEILNLSTITYELKRDPFNERKLGIIAQEALELIPEAVKTHDYKITDESQPEKFERVELERMGVTYNSLIPVLIKATQEQQEIIETQQAENDELKQKMLELERRLEALEK